MKRGRPLRPELTARQQQVLDFLKPHMWTIGAQPSYREIAEHFGWTNPVTVLQHLKALERKGWIVRTGKRRRLQIQDEEDMMFGE